VPALWVFLLPNLVTVFRRGAMASLGALLPALGLLGLGAAAAGRGMVEGVWLAPWEIAAAGLALALLWVRAPGARRTGRRKRGR
jgi:hypothetical protein